MTWSGRGRRVTHVKLSVPSFIPFTGVTSGDRAVLTQYFLALDDFAIRKKNTKLLLELVLSHNASIIYLLHEVYTSAGLLII